MRVALGSTRAVAPFVGISGGGICGHFGRDRVQKLRSQLQAYFGFDGRAYTDVAHMLAAEQPDVVDVSSPFHLHREHAIMALGKRVPGGV